MRIRCEAVRVSLCLGPMRLGVECRSAMDLVLFQCVSDELPNSESHGQPKLFGVHRVWAAFEVPSLSFCK